MKSFSWADRSESQWSPHGEESLQTDDVSQQMSTSSQVFYRNDQMYTIELLDCLITALIDNVSTMIARSSSWPDEDLAIMVETLSIKVIVRQFYSIAMLPQHHVHSEIYEQMCLLV